MKNANSPGKSYDISNINTNYRKIINENNTTVKKVILSFFLLYTIIGFSYDLLLRMVMLYGTQPLNQSCNPYCKPLYLGEIFKGVISFDYIPFMTIGFIFVALCAVFFARFNYKNVLFHDLEYWQIKKINGMISVSDDSENDMYRDIKESGKPQEDYLNIIEEMRIASVLNFMPDAYIYSDEVPNAFSMSMNKSGFIAISSGALDTLSRDELSALVAHEFGHMKCGDNKVAYYVDTLIHTLDFVLEYFQELSEFLLKVSFIFGNFSSKGKNDGRMVMLSLVFFVFTWIMRFCVPFVTFALKSFLQEATDFRADALSMKYTRNPLALHTLLERQHNYNYEIDNSTRNHSSFFLGESLSPFPSFLNFNKDKPDFMMRRFNNTIKNLELYIKEKEAVAESNLNNNVDVLSEKI